MTMEPNQQSRLQVNNLPPRRSPGALSGCTQTRRECAGLILSETTYTEDCVIERHAHEAPLFYLVLQGVCHEIVRSRAQTHSAATLVFLPAEETHATHWQKQAGLCFHLEFTPSWTSRLEESGLSGGASYSAGLPRWLAIRLHSEFRRSNASPLSVEGLALELLAEAGRHVLPAEARLPSWLRAVHDRLHDEYADSLSLGDLARAADVHPAHLARSFRREYGCTIGDAVRRLRIEAACRLLASGDTSLGEVAYSVGFSDQSHFTKTFHLLIGLTPSQFRSRHSPYKT